MDNKIFYFDVNSTTPLHEEVLDSMMPWLTTDFGNPSSSYTIGIKAHLAIEKARETIANTIGADPSEIFFTSGGSEANTWALTCFKKNFFCNLNGKILTSPIEHHSVLNAIDNAEYCDVNLFGSIETNIIEDKIKYDKNIYMVSSMYVNNEIGTIEPIHEIANICGREGVLLHVDAVQAFGHFPIRVHYRDYDNITTLSASAHKIGGPKGIGFLFIRKDIQPYYHPLIYGGKQEHGMRGSTENVAAIVGFAKACELANKRIYSLDNLRKLSTYAWDFIKDNVPNVHLNGYPLVDDRRMPNNLNISFDGINGEELVSYLDEHGIYVSTGSACNTGSEQPSHVLKAIGLSDEQANSSIRISFGYDTTLYDVNILCQNIVQGIELLRE